MGKLPLLDRSDDAALVRRIVSDNSARHWPKCSLAIVMSIVTAACTASIAFFIGKIVNATFFRESFGAVAGLSVAWMFLFIIRGLSTYWQELLMAHVGYRITAETQTRICEKILGQEVQYFADRHSAELMANIITGANSIANVLSQSIMTLGRDLFTVVGLIAVMIWQDPMLALITFLVLPPAIISLEFIVSRARGFAHLKHDGTSKILISMAEAIRGLKVVKAFGLEGAIRRRVARDVKALEKTSIRLARVTFASSPIIETFGGVAAGMAFFYGGYRILENNAPPGQLVSFMMAFILTFDYARRIARSKIDLGANLVIARRVYSLFDAISMERDDGDKPRFKVKDGRIEFSNVNFSYRPGTPVLQCLTFAAEPGRMTALVGPSGAGKTTIFNLLLRFYDVQSGSLKIDGQELSQVNRDDLRASIAYVGQDIYLFDGSIRDNILCGKPSANDDELMAAAEAAFAHDFIMSCPNGYDTVVGEAGVRLSLGQRQRIALARALVKDAPIVLLDEATASLDSESEYFIQQAIRRLCAGKTTLVVAHRLNTIRDADTIFFIEDGRIAEAGSHDELLRSSGRYATLVRLQVAEHV